jgi:hypothetical protein
MAEAAAGGAAGATPNQPTTVFVAREVNDTTLTDHPAIPTFALACDNTKTDVAASTTHMMKANRPWLDVLLDLLRRAPARIVRKVCVSLRN